MTLHSLPFAKPSIDDADLEAVQESLKNAPLSREGSIVADFEQQLAAYCEVPYAVVFQSGTAAMMAAYFAAQLTPNDRVITSPLSHISTVGSPHRLGISPKFVDINPSTGLIDLDKLKEELNIPLSRGRPFIVPFHFIGLAVDMQQLEALIKHPDAVVIEDATHAIGSCYPTGERVGCCAYSQMTTFSFDSTRTMTTGEGGAVTTYDPDLRHRLQCFRDEGIERHIPYLKKPAVEGEYEVQAITGNFHLTNFQAALGISQLKRIDRFIGKRRHLVQCYRHCLKEIPHLRMISDEQDEYTAFCAMVVHIDYAASQRTREAIMKGMKEQGIATALYGLPLYHHPIFSRQREEGELSEAENFYKQALSLPLYYDLTDEEIHRICQTLKRLLIGKD